MAKIEIPKHSEAMKRLNNGTATPLDKMVVNNEPVGMGEDQFRKDVTELVAWVKLKSYSEYRDKLQNAASEIHELKRQVMYLKSGLEFYSDRNNYLGQRDKLVLLDMGKQARDSLVWANKQSTSIPGVHFPQEG